MTHLNLAQFATGDPRTRRLRKRRGRELRAIRPSQRNELWYRGQLEAIVHGCQAAGKAVAEEIREAWAFQVRRAGDSAGRLVLDSTFPGLAYALSQAAARFGNIDARARHMADRAVEKSREAVDERLGAAILSSVGVDLRPALTAQGPIADAMRRAAAANVDLIKSLPSEYLDALPVLITKAWQEGLRWEELIGRIAHLGQVTDTRAWVIARDQTSKMNAAFNEVRQTDLGIEQYTWSDVGDRRVRPSHAFMNGRICRWDSPPAVDGESVHPGQAILCRCSAIPRVNLQSLEKSVEELEAA